MTGKIFVDICTRCNPKWTKNVENMGKVLFMSLSDIWLSLHSFSQNWELVKGIVWRAVMNFTQTSRSVYRYKFAYTWCKLWLQPSWFSWNSEACSTPVCRELMYRALWWMTNALVAATGSQTGGQTWCPHKASFFSALCKQPLKWHWKT
jgi:hypothetical protein